jgi:flagellum-specific peptidoglycan hydrolase FlgJ
MPTNEQKRWLATMAKAARDSGHIFPEMAACEAAAESAWGTSKLAAQYRNLFGEKQHKTPIFTSILMPTREFLNGQWVTVDAPFIIFPTYADSFRSRMDTLRRLAPQYPHYAAALDAQTAEDYVREVSKTWSTDPNRANVCISIYRGNADVLFPQNKGDAA